MVYRHLIWHSARKWGGLIRQSSQAHTGLSVDNIRLQTVLYLRCCYKHRACKGHQMILLHRQCNSLPRATRRTMLVRCIVNKQGIGWRQTDLVVISKSTGMGWNMAAKCACPVQCELIQWLHHSETAINTIPVSPWQPLPPSAAMSRQKDIQYIITFLINWTQRKQTNFGSKTCRVVWNIFISSCCVGPVGRYFFISIVRYCVFKADSP